MKYKARLGKLLLLIGIFHNAILVVGQTDFDAGLKTLAEKVAVQIIESKKTKVAVWDFVNTQGETTNLGRFIGEDFSVYFTNAGRNAFSVMDRNHLNQILKEHKLNSAGFIDPNTAKELGKLNAVDAIITGTVDVLDKELKVRIKVLDTESAMQISAEIAFLPIDKNVAAFLGIPGLENGGAADRGFSSSINTSEQVNNPETVSSDCVSKGTGDYCFTNNTINKLRVTIINETRQNQNNGYQSESPFTLEPGQTQCYYSRSSGSYKYVIDLIEPKTYYRWRLGNIMLEKCKSKTFIIK